MRSDARLSFDLTRGKETAPSALSKSSEAELIAFVEQLKKIEMEINDPRHKTWAKQKEISPTSGDEGRFR